MHDNSIGSKKEIENSVDIKDKISKAELSLEIIGETVRYKCLYLRYTY